MRDLRLRGSARLSRITRWARKPKQSFRSCCWCCFLFLTRRGRRTGRGGRRDCAFLALKSKSPPCLSQGAKDKDGATSSKLKQSLRAGVDRLAFFYEGFHPDERRAPAILVTLRL